MPVVPHISNYAVIFQSPVSDLWWVRTDANDAVYTFDTLSGAIESVIKLSGMTPTVITLSKGLIIIKINRRKQ